jgi:hypothetical protein
MKQQSLFGEEYEAKTETSYTSKINIPNYEPKNKKPHLLELLDDSKTKRIIQQVKNSDLPDEEKAFLIEAAKRHSVFNYQKIADYYSHASKEMQELMERQALVIIDFDKAYQYGYVKLAHELANQYFDTDGE